MLNVTIVKRAPSTFRLRIEGEKVNGKRRFSYETIHGTKAEAKRRQAQLIAGEVPVPVSAVTHTLLLGDYLGTWMSQRKNLGLLKIQSAIQYEVMFRLHVIAQLGRTPMAELTAPLMREHFSNLARSSGLGARSLRTLKTRLKAALDQARKDGLMETNPLEGLQLAKFAVSAGRIMDDEQRARFLAFMKDHPHGPLVRLALTTGMRRGELAGLKWRHVDLARGRVTVEETLINEDGNIVESGTKTVAGTRVIGIPPVMVEELRAMRARAQEMADWRGVQLGDQHVLLTAAQQRWSPSGLTNVVKKLFTRAGLEGYHLHDLRHSHASALLRDRQNLKAVSMRLGHRDARTTLSIYSHVLPNDDDALTAAAGNLLGV